MLNNQMVIDKVGGYGRVHYHGSTSGRHHSWNITCLQLGYDHHHLSKKNAGRAVRAKWEPCNIWRFPKIEIVLVCENLLPWDIFGTVSASFCIAQSISHMLHGAGILTVPTFARTKSPNFVGKYTIHGAYGIWYVLVLLLSLLSSL